MISIIFSSSPFTIIVIIINAVVIEYLIITGRIRNLSVSKVTLAIVTEAQWGQSTSVVEIIPMMELLKINHTTGTLYSRTVPTFTEAVATNLFQCKESFPEAATSSHLPMPSPPRMWPSLQPESCDINRVYVQGRVPIVITTTWLCDD